MVFIYSSRPGIQLAPHLQAYLLQIIGTIPLMPNPGPSSQATSGTQGLQVQPITPQLLTNAQGQIIATVIGNQILPVINTQGITLSPIKPGQQVRVPHQGFSSLPFSSFLFFNLNVKQILHYKRLNSFFKPNVSILVKITQIYFPLLANISNSMRSLIYYQEHNKL